MSQANHTPGPWNSHGDRVWSEFAGINRSERSNLIALSSYKLKMPDSERTANLKLIAAAPDLLAALEVASSVMACHELQDSQYDNARKVVREAIAKAKGATHA